MAAMVGRPLCQPRYCFGNPTHAGNGGGDMRNGGSGVITIFGLVLVCMLAAAFACSISGKGVAVHSIDTYATAEARPPSVGERAAAIR